MGFSSCVNQQSALMDGGAGVFQRSGSSDLMRMLFGLAVRIRFLPVVCGSISVKFVLAMGLVGS
jgi:hypothetical protein